MSRVENFKHLIAWQKGMDLVEAVYRLSAGFPDYERFGLGIQIRRAAMSVPSNIDEGFGRSNRADFLRFLDIARGSANEVETQILIAIRLRYAVHETARSALDLSLEVQRILAGLEASLRRSEKLSVRRQLSP